MQPDSERGNLWTEDDLDRPFVVKNQLGGTHIRWNWSLSLLVFVGQSDSIKQLPQDYNQFQKVLRDHTQRRQDRKEAFHSRSQSLTFPNAQGCKTFTHTYHSSTSTTTCRVTIGINFIVTHRLIMIGQGFQDSKTSCQWFDHVLLSTLKSLAMSFSVLPPPRSTHSPATTICILAILYF